MFSIPVANDPIDLMVRQTGPTSIRVAWTPPSSLGATTGYTVFYSPNGGTLEISGGGSSDVELPSLTEGEEYTVTLVARSQHLPSRALSQTLQLVRGTTCITEIHMHFINSNTLPQFPLSWS